LGITPDERRELTQRLTEVRAQLRAVEEQINLAEWKKLYNEMLKLERRLRESEAGK
jgi:hypothetical protein